MYSHFLSKLLMDSVLPLCSSVFSVVNDFCRRINRAIIASTLPVCLCLSALAQQSLKVCADPDNLPYSNRARQGFENRIAELLARDMNRKLVYHWSRMGRGFVRDVLNKNECDVLIEIPRTFPRILTTPAYFSSSYVFVTRKSRNIDVSSFDDSVLRHLEIGIQVLDDDYAPPAQALARRGVIGNIIGFDTTGTDAGDIIRAVATRKIDLAIVWGPLAGYYARQYGNTLTLTPVPAFDSPGIPFRYEISMGVRKSDKELRDKLTEFLNRRKFAITRVLRSYGVPLIVASDQRAALGGN